MSNPLGMCGLSFIEVATDTPERLRSILSALGFARTHRHRAMAIDAYRQGSMLILANLEPGSFAARFRAAHGPCISALGFAVDDPRAAFEEAVRRGARPYEGPRAPSFDLPAIYGIGDSLVYLTPRTTGVERELVALDRPDTTPERGFLAFDHLTNNVPKGALNEWSDFYKDVFGFTEVRTFDIHGAKTGLRSYALRSPCGSFCIPINEDKDERGQIAEYLREYRGPGVQHVALLTRDILASMDAVGGAIPMLDIDADYYEEAFRRVPVVREDKARIVEHQVLVDGDADGYLLQIFTKNLLGPIFIELIQRENHRSFGEGNFSALFRSIERDQEKRGTL